MSLLNSVLVRDAEPGMYTVTVREYRECKPQNRQPYILVTMLIDGLIIDDRWYANRIPYIMHCLRKQYNMQYLDCTLSQLLEYARTDSHLPRHAGLRSQIRTPDRLQDRLTYKLT